MNDRKKYVAQMEAFYHEKKFYWEMKDLCIARVKELYKDDRNAQDYMNRLTQEFTFIKNYHHTDDFWLRYELVKEADRIGHPVFAGHTMANSFVAYLLGITPFNPMDEKLPYEMYFGVDGDFLQDLRLTCAPEVISDLGHRAIVLAGEDYLRKMDERCQPFPWLEPFEPARGIDNAKRERLEQYIQNQRSGKNEDRALVDALIDGLKRNWENFADSQKETEEILGMVDSGKLRDLARAVSLLLSGEPWAGYAREQIKEKGFAFSEVITCRDDVFSMLGDCGMNVTDAYRIKHRVRIGRSITADMVEQLREYPVPQWFIEYSSGKEGGYLAPLARGYAYLYCEMLRLE